jgi:uncharacterized protein YebE (UPF0316 family)
MAARLAQFVFDCRTRLSWSTLLLSPVGHGLTRCRTDESGIFHTMDKVTLFSCLLIFSARVCDVSLGTLRVLMVTQGRRSVAACLGFVEVLIWVAAVSRVIGNLGKPAFAIAYAAGYACGNFTGLTVERWFAIGRQVVRVFSRRGPALAERLRTLGFLVTLFEGVGRDGPVHLLLLETERREVPRLVSAARELDPLCYYVIDDIRVASSATNQARSRWSLRNRK